MILLLVALGGAVGALCRYGLGALMPKASSGFPAGTFVVNVLGCVLVGFLARMFVDGEADSQLQALFIVGFCGGFTTFSTFSLETLGLMQNGEWLKASVYVAGSVLTCLAGTALGIAAGRVTG